HPGTVSRYGRSARDRVLLPRVAGEGEAVQVTGGQAREGTTPGEAVAQNRPDVVVPQARRPVVAQLRLESEHRNVADEIAAVIEVEIRTEPQAPPPEQTAGGVLLVGDVRVDHDPIGIELKTHVVDLV